MGFIVSCHLSVFESSLCICNSTNWTLHGKWKEWCKNHNKPSSQRIHEKHITTLTRKFNQNIHCKEIFLQCSPMDMRWKKGNKYCKTEIRKMSTCETENFRSPYQIYRVTKKQYLWRKWALVFKNISNRYYVSDNLLSIISVNHAYGINRSRISLLRTQFHIRRLLRS